MIYGEKERKELILWELFVIKNVLKRIKKYGFFKIFDIFFFFFRFFLFIIFKNEFLLYNYQTFIMLLLV